MWFRFRLSRNVSAGLPWWLAIPIMLIYVTIMVTIWACAAVLWLGVNGLILTGRGIGAGVKAIQESRQS